MQTPPSQPQGGGKGPFIAIIVILILAAVGYAFYSRNKNKVSNSHTDQNTQTLQGDNSGNATNSADNTMGNDDGTTASTTPSSTPSDGGATSAPHETTNPNSPVTAPTPAAAVKTFTVQGQNFSFSPSEIKVNKGDKVKITFQNTGGFHDFVLDEFNVKTDVIGSGQSATVEFTADKTGTFQYYCSVGNHRQMGMVGNLIVQ